MLPTVGRLGRFCRRPSSSALLVVGGGGDSPVDSLADSPVRYVILCC